MAREVPEGWRKVDRYHMVNGTWSICRVWVCGEMIWELWRVKSCVFRAKDADGGFQQAVDLAAEMMEVAA